MAKNPQVTVTRRLHFSAAHRVHNPAMSDEENRRTFGKCNNPNWHGHNYELDVTVEGPVDPATGFLMDLKLLKDLVERRVLADVDHKNLNTEVRWLDGVNPSTENVAVAIWGRLADQLPSGVRLAKVLLRETPRNWVEYTGPLGT